MKIYFFGIVFCFYWVFVRMDRFWVLVVFCLVFYFSIIMLVVKIVYCIRFLFILLNVEVVQIIIGDNIFVVNLEDFDMNIFVKVVYYYS